MKKDLFSSLLLKLTVDECRDFMRMYTSKDRNFKTEFELFFADKDERVNIEQKYSSLVKQIIKKRSKGGYIDYRESYSLAVDIDNLLDNGRVYIEKSNFRDAFALVRAILKPMMEVITRCDDSNGYLGGAVGEIIQFLKDIASAESMAMEIKEEIFVYVQTELGNNDYFDYGDYGYELFYVLELLAFSIGNNESYIAYLDILIQNKNQKLSDYKKEYFTKKKIDYLEKTGKVIEAQKMVSDNMEIVEIRKNVVNKLIDKKDYLLAKKLIREGIEIAKLKEHPGRISEWKKVLLQIAVLENDTESIRNYAKIFTFDRGFYEEYYKQWKATYNNEEWLIEINKYIVQIQQTITDQWKNDKNKYWRTEHPQFLSALAQVYIQEKQWDQLFLAVKHSNNLDDLINYQSHLKSHYSDQLIALFVVAFENFGNITNSRYEYVDLVNKMKNVIKEIPQAKKALLNVAQQLKEKYSTKPRRPAMIEELNKILL